MSTLVFISIIVALFTTVFAWERNTSENVQPNSLLRWLVSDNWPAKVGAALLIIGTGALLRYLMLNIAFPPSTKLLAGVVFSVIFGGASAMLKTNPKLRAMHLALGGAALGTAYLTAYSAYGFFGFVSDMEALGLLLVVACGATIFAITTRALSIALLAMVGAYIAPAFALEAPSLVPVYGYYLLASFLTLLMVWQRGWRPLIHLSFLFTLAGALFFGWTQKFYTPEYYSQMQPLLLSLVTIHLAMPLFELRDSASKALNGSLLRRFDLGYFLLLPLVALLLTLLIAPDVNRDGAIGVLALSVLWMAAAGIQHIKFQNGASHYIGIAVILLVIAAMLGLGGVSPFLISTVVTCALLAFGPKLGMPKEIDGLLITAALASAACYLLQALFEPVALRPFFNVPFTHHAILAIAFTVAGLRMRQRELSFAPVFLSLAGAWFVIASAREFSRLYLDYLPQAFHLLLLGLSIAYAVWLKWKTPKLSLILILGIALFYTGMFGANGFPNTVILPLMLAGQLIFSLLAYMASRHVKEGESVAGVARSLLPLILLPWAIAYSKYVGAQSSTTVVMVLLVTSALLASLQAQLTLPKGRFWPNTFSPVGFIIFGFWLFFQTLFHIERETWAIAYELIALTYIILTLRFLQSANNRDVQFFSVITVIAVTSVSAAMLLRLIGPPGTLTILALNDMLLPAVVSLLWAGIGGLITWQSTQKQSRRLWTLGAIFLVAAAIKLVLFDFGSLGQLGNIIAMMGAGGVFLLVAWLAPFPPRIEKSLPKNKKPVSPVNQGGNQNLSTPNSLPTVNKPTAAQTYAIAGVATSISPASKTTSATSRGSEDGQSKEASSRTWLWILIGLILIGFFMRTSQQEASERRAKAQAELVALQQQRLKIKTEPDEILINKLDINSGDNAAVSANTIYVAPVTPPTKPEVVSSNQVAAPIFPEGTELHAIGVYEGALPNGQKTQPWWKNCPTNSGNTQAMMECHTKYAGLKTSHTVTVNVTRSKAPMVIALMAYEPVIWNIELKPEAVIKKIILAGYHGQDVRGVSELTPVEVYTYESSPCTNCSRQDGYFYSYTSESQEYTKMVNRLRTITGLDLTTFQGTYKSEKFSLSNTTNQ